MRTYTLLLSIACHVLAVCAIVIVTVTAADELPAVRRAVDFIEVAPPQPPPPPPPVQRPLQARTQTAAIPVDAPEGIAPEPPAPEPSPIDVPIDSIVSADLGGLPPVVVGELPPPAPAQAPLRVGGVIQAPRKVANVPPVYPTIAKSAGIQGVVILEALIAEDGTVNDVRVLRSIPLLDSAAVEAVRQWRFTPTLLNGSPVPVLMTVTVAFNLR